MARLPKEQEEQAAGRGEQAAIVDYACQFVGNPYVWRYGPYLGKGRLFGFVTQRSVFAFGNLASAYDMEYENAGTAVRVAISLICGALSYEWP